MEDAPFHADLADAPEGGQVVWRHADDGVRLRLGAWHAENSRGTVLLYPGRTEYIEKYGRVIRDLVAAHWSVALIDWRGQGLSDRLDDDGRLGHVVDFLDYQRDAATFLDWVKEIELPRPHVLLAHSMGGCIGLRSLVNGLDVARAVFSAPMWGIQMPGYARPLTYVLPPVARLLKREAVFAPGTKPTSYLVDTAFAENMLTADPTTFGWLCTQVATVPGFALGGPSVQWVGSATLEMDRLMGLSKPNVPTLTFVGTREQIVSIEAIERYHANWPQGELRKVTGAKHEMMMEVPEIRARFLSDSLGFLSNA
ncbi:MAG: alpha/beta hydrolase [Pseudomonadota bacterium]